MITRILGGLTALALVAFSMQSAEAASWKFNVHNKSSGVVKSFRTQEDGDWSNNWIKGDKMAPGDTFEMDFGTDEGKCTVRTRITFTDDDYFDEDIDYCKVSNIYLYEKTLKVD